MGSCLCKRIPEEVAPIRGVSDSESSVSADSIAVALQVSRRNTISQYILQMLEELSKASQPNNDTPIPQVGLNMIAESPDGWREVFEGLVTTLPMSEALGASTIATIFDQCPLPAVKTVFNVLSSMKLGSMRARSYNRSGTQHHELNMLLLLGCMAERYAGDISTKLLNKNVFEYICTFLMDRCIPDLVIQALVTIEMFAKTTKNKQVFQEYFLSQEEKHSLLELEGYSSEDPLWRQVRFCARWLLDNHFFVPGRSLSYTTVDMSDKNVILNFKDVTEFLKIDSDGLMARCDSHTLESARSTFKVSKGCWYYEAKILSGGVMQIGWASEKTIINSSDGYGVGDDSFSLGYDGCRRMLWFKAEPLILQDVEPWTPGDIVGCLIDVGRQEAIFSINGIRLPICKDICQMISEGFYAAASFMYFQGVQFNFGADEFRHAPTDREFMTFNDHAALKDEEKQVIPRWLVHERLQATPQECVDEDMLCNICFDRRAEVALAPCLHSSFCRKCASCLVECPMCRRLVRHYMLLPL